MPVGAVIGGAVIGAGGSIASGAMGASAQKKAAQTAADSSLAVADKNNALYREIYGENKALLQPYSDRGTLASNALTDLLLGTHTFNPSAATPATAPASGSTSALSGFQSAPVVAKVPLGSDPSSLSPAERAIGFGDEPGALSTIGPTSIDNRVRGGALRARLGAAGISPGPGTSAGPITSPQPAAPPASDGAAPPSALSAWDQFRQGTNYQWRLNQGMGALNSSYAANGTFDSGAADKGRIEYGQNFASNELANYMNLLAGQQAMGLSAAGAVAGVGTTYAGNIAAQNTNAGNAAANAALIAGQGKANMYGSIGQGVGQIGGALFQYGMGQMQPQAAYNPGAGGIVVNPNVSSAGAVGQWGGF